MGKRLHELSGFGFDLVTEVHKKMKNFHHRALRVTWGCSVQALAYHTAVTYRKWHTQGSGEISKNT